MKIDFGKFEDGLAPAIIQDAQTSKVLMLGYMNKKALRKTRKKGLVTFFSRSRQEFWVKGETSGNYLEVKEILTDCDGDAILIKAYPKGKGKVCHKGKDTCFAEKNKKEFFLHELESVIRSRKSAPKKSSRTSRLFDRGPSQIAKKFGEESVELVIEATNADDQLFLGEAGDVMYHFLVMLADRDMRLDDVVEVLRKRRN
ncbi:MAG: bifunctional phosphoribosyl-AMP cyclohydrolase/phosphoribosyl-ATP diphosphatase HisIE [Acidobacteria bacterium]|nr:MAG: bifunctional phosphoribosyl-AMP cyclohydrolase/phosphoribosyl-ATP diphosphatase HisIE [Acidobacteriota bacterium]REK03169.1 MAG: bifunctional phosphoribosyl-AMP cyclohydrolase/phosphoribosyl-ATP diphosphatase HisIE [Acidobacteriota bacterium]REK15377.1 MAG: bifunctional phosphoribosyl-AMP cyclohydrolase/phosphoribosyl-ATP diphosphatase HisIE [Acidobacteriota bacterium]REK42096.1 MAG: bifunctional phosphoribosyl-AMP cyclohydrolase/phosphoribosyl-ATP diphosphatase HisIE [Acidobacteriota ba